MHILFLLNLLVCYAHADVILFDDRLLPFVNRFKYYAVEYWPALSTPLPPEAFDNLIMKIEPTRDLHADGECNFQHEKRVIVIDSTRWLQYSEAKREAVVIHELGHCVLNLDHDNKQCGDTPCHIMNHQTPSGEDYTKHKQEYLQDLFFNAVITRKREAE